VIIIINQSARRQALVSGSLDSGSCHNWWPSLYIILTVVLATEKPLDGQHIERKISRGIGMEWSFSAETE